MIQSSHQQIADRKHSRSLPAWLVNVLVGIILFSPLASGVRGISPPLGHALMALCDAGILGIFLVTASLDLTQLSAMTILLTAYLLLYPLAVHKFPDYSTALLGVRKTVMIFVALAAGSGIALKHRSRVHLAIIISLFYVCLYAIKQYFSFSAYDMLLLSDQSANYYTNYFGGRFRAISFLSSGFHVGMASCVLCAYALCYRRVRLWLRVVLYLTALWACYAAFTRTFLLIFALITLYGLAQRAGSAGKFLMLGGGIVALLVTSLVDRDFFPGILQETTGDQRFLNRGASYTGFSTYMSHHWYGLFFGFGPGSAGSALGDIFRAYGATWIEPHNIFTKYVFELGFPFGLLIIILGVIIFARAIRNGGEEKPILVSMTLILAVSGLMITSVETWPIVIYVGLALGMYLNVRPNSIEEPDSSTELVSSRLPILPVTRAAWSPRASVTKRG